MSVSSGAGATDADLTARSPAVAYVFCLDPDGVPSFIYVSKACAEVYGFTAERAVADVGLVQDAIHPADRERFDRAGAISTSTAEEMVWEGRILRTDGRERSVLITSRLQRHGDGSLKWHGVVVDSSSLRTPPELVAATSTAGAEEARS